LLVGRCDTVLDAEGTPHVELQVQDYLVALRLGDGQVLEERLRVLLAVIIMLSPKHDYVVSMTTFISSLNYWKANKDVLPFYNMWLNQPNLFDGEQGEVYFGVMSRVVIKDTDHRLNHLKSKYALCGEYVRTNNMLEDYMIDSGLTPKAASRKGLLVTDDNENLRATKEFLWSAMIELRTCSYGVYANKNAFKSALAAGLHKVDPKIDRTIPARIFQKMTRHQLEGVWSRTQSLIHKPEWAQEQSIRVVWPEIPEPAPREPRRRRSQPPVEEPEWPAGVGLQEQALDNPEPAQPDIDARRPKGKSSSAGGRSETEPEAEALAASDGEVEEGHLSGDDQPLNARKRTRSPFEPTVLITQPGSQGVQPNRLADETREVQEEYERLYAKWLEDHPSGTFTTAMWTKMGEQARTNLALRGGGAEGRSMRSRSSTRTRLNYNGMLAGEIDTMLQ